MSNGDSHQKPYLLTHHAQGACRRQTGALMADVAKSVSSVLDIHGPDSVETRLTPDRCVVQVGESALTLSWLGSKADSPAEGQLLAMVWKGAIPLRKDLAPERRQLGSSKPAPTIVWESAYVITASNEESWRWHAATVDSPGLTSAEVRAECMTQLLAAQGATRE